MSQPKSPRRRVTLEDVARVAGVGIATVDRALNERGNVSAKMAEKILAAARVLELRRGLPGTYRRTLRIEVILPRPELSLIARMNESFARLARRVDRSVVIHRAVPRSDDPGALAARIRGALGEASMPPITPSSAAVAEVSARDVAVVTIISDLPGNSPAGLCRDRPLCGWPNRGISPHPHAAVRRRGAGALRAFRHPVARGAKPRLFGRARRTGGVTIAEILEGGDDVETSELLLRRAIPRHAPVRARYNVGAGNRAIAAVISPELFPPPPLFIGHELTPYTIPMLPDGRMTFALDQNPDQQAAFAVDVILSDFGHADPCDLRPPYVSPVPVTLYSPRNLRRSAELLRGASRRERLGLLGVIASEQPVADMTPKVLDAGGVKGADRRLLNGPNHPLGLTIGPGMAGPGQPVPDPAFRTDGAKDVRREAALCPPVMLDEPRAIVGQHRVDLVGNGPGQTFRKPAATRFVASR